MLLEYFLRPLRLVFYGVLTFQKYLYQLNKQNLFILLEPDAVLFVDITLLIFGYKKTTQLRVVKNLN